MEDQYIFERVERTGVLILDRVEKPDKDHPKITKERFFSNSSFFSEGKARIFKRSNFFSFTSGAVLDNDVPLQLTQYLPPE
uniref:Uncharacterized protein n=1 Tax=Picea sitchensis TaxID=3332 RepID=A0A6B9XVL7_PICSI|nr:hypothetical protein Q903MT_gene4308 [Picea sitchensis]